MRRVSPYQGLVPYNEEDAEFFFGRDSLRDIIVANLMASRLTLLYGPSGVGKSSVLRAGVEHHLKNLTDREIKKGGKAEFACIVFNSWRDNPIDALERIIENRVTELAGPKSTSPATKRAFVDSLADWTERIDGDIYVVLDQFEEYFLYHPNEEEAKSFAFQFPEAVNRPNLRVNFLVSIREDALAKLDVFKSRISGLFENYLRIDHLDRAAAKEAIEGPVELYNRLYRADKTPISIEPRLTAAVVNQVRAGKLSLGETGGGVIDVKTTAELVETPYLQLVMTRLWNEELAAGSSTLTLATLERLGNAETIVRTHLDETMSSLAPDERKIAAEAFDYLVTPSGTKIAYYASDLAKHLAKHTEITSRELEPVLEKLATGRNLILRKVAVTTDPDAPPRYEIFHDVLAKAVLDWSSRFKIKTQIFENIMADVQEKASRLRLGLTSIIVLALAVLVLGVLLYTKTRQTHELEDQIRALKIVKIAKSKLAENVDVAVLLAREAVRLADLPETQAILRESLARNPSLLIMRTGKAPVESVAFTDDGSFAVLTSADGVRIWDLKSRKQLPQLKQPSKPEVSAVSDNSELGVTGSSTGGLCIWKIRTGEIIKCFDGHVEHAFYMTHAEFSRDGRYILTADSHRYVRVWNTAGTPLAELHHGFKVNWAEFSPNGDLIASASADNTARIWEWKKGSNAFKPLPHDAEVHVAKFSPNGEFIATGSEDGKVTLWKAGTGERISMTTSTIGSIRIPIMDLSFSPDGTKIATAGRAYTGLQPTAEIWSLPKKVASIKNQEPAGLITNIVFSADGEYVLTAYSNGFAMISSATTGEPVCRYGGTQFVFHSAAFNPDGKSVITVGSSFGGMGRLWRICYQQRDNAAWEYSASVPDLLQAVNERIGRQLTDWERDYIPP